VSPADLLAAVRDAIGDPGITRIGARPETLR
jgi:hypothetical protein